MENNKATFTNFSKLGEWPRGSISESLIVTSGTFYLLLDAQTSDRQFMLKNYL